MTVAVPTLPATNEAVGRIRAFNRWYTRRLDILADHFLSSPFSLVEARLLWELANRERPAAAEIARDLGLDPGQTSHLLKRFEARRLIRRTPSPDDARRSLIELTDAGCAAFASMNAEQYARIATDLARLAPEAVGRMTAAMTDVRRLSDPDTAVAPLVIRPHRAGEIAWICYRQIAFYADVWGFRGSFEPLVLDVGRRFLEEFDPRRDASYLVEVDGRIVGSILVVHSDDPAIAKLRLLWVESEMRGRGLGRRLVDEAVRFARDAGYAKLTLWTQDVLVEARRIYTRAGFRPVSGEPNSDYGPTMISESWELAL
ncbi:MAG: helix-turn-helix domain-containing GNAT family N-acetyltransferase [Ancalomicrobiaceae bacterium]|nr:helix-turn-helix domain-containing GNAT family N-acetyltransferase [Ancalomicrobiaceae bacterium]